MKGYLYRCYMYAIYFCENKIEFQFGQGLMKEINRKLTYICNCTLYIYMLCATASSTQHACCHVNWPTHVTDSVSERMAGQTDIRFLLLQGPPFTSLYILPDDLRHTSVRNIGDEVAKRTLRAQNTHLN